VSTVTGLRSLAREIGTGTKPAAHERGDAPGDVSGFRGNVAGVDVLGKVAVAWVQFHRRGRRHFRTDVVWTNLFELRAAETGETAVRSFVPVAELRVMRSAPGREGVDQDGVDGR